MAIPEVAMLDKVAAPEVWTDEAHHFTPWLARNLDILAEALAIDLTHVQTEAPVGNFRLDILARDEKGTMVAIENQFDATNHRHLGQLLTYATGSNASILIWVTESFKDEHRTALECLNRWTRKKIEIYGVEVHAVAIGKSIRVPRFVPVVLPATRSKEPVVALQARSFASDTIKEAFFQPLVDDMWEEGFTYTPKGWIGQFDSKSVTGLTYNASIENSPRVFMDMKDKSMKRRVFRDLRKYKRRMKRIEKELGIEGDQNTRITWGKGKRNNNISVSRKKSQDHPIYSYDELEKARDWMFEYLIKFEDVFDGEVAEIMDIPGWTR